VSRDPNFKRAAAIVTEVPDVEVPPLEQVSAVLDAIEALSRGGFRLVLVERTEVVIRRNQRRRWWRRPERKEK
jgi:hypothetical protein